MDSYVKILATMTLLLTFFGNRPAYGQDDLSFFPSQYDFGGLDPSEETSSQSFLFTNTADLQKNCDEAFIEGEDGASFSIDVNETTCSWGAMTPGESCVVEVVADPKDSGVKEATLQRFCEGEPSSVGLRAFGHSPKLFVTPSVFDFGSVVVDGLSGNQTFTFVNDGEGTAKNCLLPRLEGENYRDFTIAATSTCGAGEMSPGSSCFVDIMASPLAAGVKTANLVFECEQEKQVKSSFIARAPVPFPELSLSPQTYNFGNSVTGVMGDSQTFSFSNQGTGKTKMCSAPVLTGRDRHDFFISADFCQTTDLDPLGDSCQVEVVPFPTTIGEKTATLTRTCLIGGTVRTQSNGLITFSEDAFADLAIAPESHDFGAVLVNDESEAFRFTVENSGNTSSECNTPAFTGSNSSDFLFAGTSTCESGSLAAQSECYIDVIASPESTGAKNAVVSFSCGDDGEMLATVESEGVFPNLETDPNEFDFGEILAGEDSAAQTFVFENNGDHIATGCSEATLIGDHPGSFSIENDSCGDDDLGVSASCSLDIVASPESAGVLEALVQRECSVGGVSTASLLVTGIYPVLELTPESEDFGDILVGETSAHTLFVIENSGTADATSCQAPALSGPDSGDFVIANDTCDENDLAMTSSCQFEVRLSPNSTGEKEAIVSRECLVGEQVQASLTGVGIAPDLAIDPQEHDFGQVEVLSTSNEFSFTVTNSGDADASGCSAPNFTGGDALEFSVENTTTCSSQLESNDQCTIVVTVTPESTGPKSTQLSYSCLVGGSLDATLEAQGFSTSMAELTIAPEDFDFGPTQVGQSVGPETFTVTNIGDSDAANCLAPFLSGNDAADFTIENSSTCSAGNLSQGGDCFIDVSFDPQTQGFNKTADIEFSCDSGEVFVSAEVTGSASDGSLIATDFMFDTEHPVNPYGVFFESDSETHPTGDDIVAIQWDFGDGSSPILVDFDSEEDSQMVFHYYLFEGATEDFEVTKTVIDEFDNIAFYQETITLTKGEAPVPILDIDNTTITAGQTVNFDGSNAFDPDSAGILFYGIEFGDGNGGVATTPFASHLYNQQGVYPITFGLMTNDYHVGSFDELLRIYVDEPDEGQPPHVNFKTSDLVGEVPLTVSLDATTHSFDTDGTIDRFIYYVDDLRVGRRFLEGPIASVEYDRENTYGVMLRGIDDDGLVGRNENDKLIYAWDDVNELPELQIFVEKTSLNTVRVRTLPWNGPYHIFEESLLWDFGDGETAVGSSADHFYSSFGSYTITLSARGINGEIVTTSHEVLIADDQGAEANFSAPMSVNVNDTVTFSPSGSSGDLNDPNNPVTVYWDFKDGEGLVEAEEVDYTFDKGAGIIDIDLYVVNSAPPVSNGLSKMASRRVRIYDGTPPDIDVDIQVDPSNHRLVSFDASGTVIDATGGATYTWKFNESGVDQLFPMRRHLVEVTDVKFSELITHEFEDDGMTQVELFVMDSKENVSREVINLNIGPTVVNQEMTSKRKAEEVLLPVSEAREDESERELTRTERIKESLRRVLESYNRQNHGERQ